ncbi:MAG: preprotein translocase subunit YajC [Parachlamydiaceae bacterium]|nr:preprotein translocase subunit YajC [Parachlamydiaceae bacterium]
MKAKLYASLMTVFLAIQTSVWANDEVIAPPDQSFWQTLVMIGIAFLFFYIILWRPEQKRRKALEQQRSALKKGDRVVAMGIIGTVVRIEDQTVIVKMFDGTSKIEFFKAAITDILPEAEKADKNDSKKNDSDE